MALVVVCKSAREPLRHAEMKLGYNCTVCDEPLQAGPMGQRAITSGGKPFCSPCGWKLLREIDPKELAGTLWTPQALDTLSRLMKKAENARNN